MAKRKSDQIEIEEVEQVSASRYSTPIWEKYPNLLLYALAAIALAVAGWWLYKELIVKPKQVEAVAAMWQAEQQFARDSFQLALNDPGGGYDGFLALADKFSGTPAGNLAHYYAGVCYLQSGDYDNAIAQMEEFSAEGELLPAMKNGIIGDCYSEKEDYAKALDYYEKAAESTENNMLGLYYWKKLGMLHDHQGNKEEAIKAFERIRRDYANLESSEWQDIEKYIYRLKGAN
ncbi:MAG: tetratricopeptide repeat protein [Saprospiraceae bacterium]